MALGLFTDLYELTMAAAYVAEDRGEHEATFDLFVRRLPPGRPYLVACGIDTALDLLEQFRFDADDLAYLASLDTFAPSFLDWLGGFRVRGEVRAVAEGELVFADEPLLSFTGPIVTGQLLETLLINVVGFETMVATKASLVVEAAAGRPVTDFSARRDHGLDAALRVARASAVGGAAGTSLVAAARRYGLRPVGTMAHSYVMSHDREEDAFTAFLQCYREQAVLLVDTYDTPEGARRAVAAMRATGIRARGVRIDSGDLAEGARATRAILDEAGYHDVAIFLSGDLDEDRIGALVAAGAPVDAFGVGTRMGTSADAPYLSIVYKLVAEDGRPRHKTSPGKRSLPGRKQVWRRPGIDVIALDDEPGPERARPLLAPVWRDGRLGEAGPLTAAAERRAEAVAGFTGPPDVRCSAALEILAGATPGATGGGS